MIRTSRISTADNITKLALYQADQVIIAEQIKANDEYFDTGITLPSAPDSIIRQIQYQPADKYVKALKQHKPRYQNQQGLGGMLRASLFEAILDQELRYHRNHLTLNLEAQMLGIRMFGHKNINQPEPELVIDPDGLYTSTLTTLVQELPEPYKTTFIKAAGLTHVDASPEVRTNRLKDDITRLTQPRNQMDTPQQIAAGLFKMELIMSVIHKTQQYNPNKTTLVLTSAINGVLDRDLNLLLVQEDQTTAWNKVSELKTMIQAFAYRQEQKYNANPDDITEWIYGTK